MASKTTMNQQLNVNSNDDAIGNQGANQQAGNQPNASHSPPSSLLNK
jgi:hypothetical protein